jgi:putative hydrolase of the HAD superfamily
VDAGADAGAVIRAVLFDAAGTLIEVAEPVGETYARCARGAGLTVSATALESAFRAVFPAAPPLAFPGAAPAALADLERDWWRRRVLETFARAGLASPRDALERAFDAAFAHFARASAWRLFDDVRPSIEALRERGIRLAVVSNFDGRLRRILRELGLADAFEAIVLSSECGFAKPDPRIFEAALTAVGADAGSTLHVGDSLGDDVVAARRAGIAAVRIERGAAGDADTITTLAEVAADRIDRAGTPRAPR